MLARLAILEVTTLHALNETDVTGQLPDDAHRMLSGPVRSRVISLVSEVLPELPSNQLPASLKRVASFASGRRTRLAGSQIAAALESDDAFRDRVAAHVRTRLPELAAALDVGTSPPAADPTEVAALSYLLRPEKWQVVVATAQEVAEAEIANTANAPEAAAAERMRRQLDDTADKLKTARERHRAEVAALKSENADLRRKLGDTRTRLRAAESELESAGADLAELRRMARENSGAAEAEVRRLRARIERLEDSVAQQRRAERTDRETENMRARLLLDTLFESVQGLRRELALPAVESTPAALVEGELAQEGIEASPGHGSLALDDPMRLDQLLGLPRCHIIIDGYNVTMNAWPDQSLEQQRDRLVGGLAPLAARTSAEVTVVFDAAEKQRRPVVNRPRGVRVLFSPVGVIADDVIRDLVMAEPRGRPIVVVSDDQEVVRDVTKAGARAARGAALTKLLGRG